jgi:hypothetical protein
MHRGFLWQLLRYGPALKEEVEHRKRVEEIIDFLEIAAIRKIPVGRLPYGLQKRVELGCALAMEPDLLLLDEPMAGINLEEKEDMSRFIRHDHCADRARNRRGHGPLRPRGRARLRAEDRRRDAGRGQEGQECHPAIWVSRTERAYDSGSAIGSMRSWCFLYPFCKAALAYSDDATLFNSIPGPVPKCAPAT